MRALVTFVFLLSACVHEPQSTSSIFASLCDKSFAGKVVSTDPQDENWRAERLLLGPINCATAGTIQMPLAVGNDNSRTWFISGSGSTLELRHQHLLDDGSLDPVSDYGGQIDGAPSEKDGTWIMNFPADEKTKAIFTANNLAVSNSNVWTFEITPKKLFAYELKRENRHFRAEFDLENPIHP